MAMFIRWSYKRAMFAKKSRRTAQSTAGSSPGNLVVALSETEDTKKMCLFFDSFDKIGLCFRSEKRIT
jgi:hypothetical protein